MNKSITLCLLSVSSVLLTGCSATQMMISKRHLEVKTKTSASVFLDPVPDQEKSIYVQLHNTSGQPGFDIRPSLITQLKGKGYHLTTHLNQAHYLLQANILQVGKSNPSANEKYLAGGYGSAISGAAVGVTTAAIASTAGGSLLAGGLIGGVVSTMAGSFVKDVTYTAVTDVQISERTYDKIRQRSYSHLAQGLNTEVTQDSSSQTHWRRYRTRVVSTAEKVNLSFKSALPKLKIGLSHAISGFF